MKLLLILLISYFTSFSQVVGNDVDENGCKPSAGYTYSTLKKECIRVFEQDIKLNEVNPTGSSSSMAAVIFSNNRKKAEVFLTDGKFILTSSSKNQWSHASYRLVFKKSYLLYKGKTLIYKQ